MCFGVRFSLYLASCLPDFDHFFLCVWFGGGGGDNVGTRKKGGTNLKKGGGTGPPVPPPLDPPMPIQTDFSISSNNRKNIMVAERGFNNYKRRIS